MRSVIDHLLARRGILALLALALGGVIASGIVRTTTDTRDSALLSNCSLFGHFVRFGGPRDVEQFLSHVAGLRAVRC